MILYASVHEKEAPNGALRRGMACLKARFPRSKLPCRPRFDCLRDIFDAIFSRPEKRLPVAPAPSQLPSLVPTVYYHLRRFRLDGLWHFVL